MSVKSYFDFCRWEYIKLQSSGDSLWESFPQVLQSRDGAGRYINAFQAPFQELSPLTNHEMYVLRACSLLVIPLPIGRAVPQGGFPTDLMQINLSAWASLVQDVAASLQVLPPRLSNSLDPEILSLLHRLEAVTQVKFCCLCYYPETNCRCAGVPPMTPPTSWSQIMEQTLGIWDDRLLQWSDYSEYLLGRYVRTSATSTRDFHLGPISVESPYVPEAGHNPAVQTSCWEGQMAEGRYEDEGSGATGSSDGPSHLSATSTLPESTSNPISAAGAAAE